MMIETRAEYVEFEQPAETDDQLVARAKAGDESATEELFGRHYDGVRQFVRFRTNKDADADDVTQETFMRAFRHLGSYKEGSFSGWLYTIAKNTFNTYYQKEKRESGKIVSGDSHDWRYLHANDPDPSEQVTIQEDTDRIINELPEPHRDAFKHVFVDGWSPKEYAALRGISRVTVGTRVNRGRATFLEMQDEGVLTGYHTRQKP